MTRPRRTVTVPSYTIGVALLTVVACCLLTLWAGVAISNRNAARLIDRYEADKAQTEAANRDLYCELFGSQLDAFADAVSPAGKASYRAWLNLYRLAGCQPERK